MSIYSGPNIISDGLQISLDWGNKNCYSGSGTTFFNIVDKSRNNGYIKNNCSYSPNFGGYIQTNGGQPGGLYDVGDRIDINTSTAGIDRFSGIHNFTVLFWNYWIGGDGKIWSTGSAGAGTGASDNCIWQMWIDYTQFYWWNSGGGGLNNITCTFNSSRVTNTWQMIAVTYSYNESGNNVARTYVNGIEVGLGTTATATHSYIDRSNQTDLQWTLGGGYASSCYNSNSVNRFGPFLLFNKTLSQPEIFKNFIAMRSRFKV